MKRAEFSPDHYLLRVASKEEFNERKGNTVTKESQFQINSFEEPGYEKSI